MKFFVAAAVLATVAVAQLDTSSINPCILECAGTGATAAGCKDVTDLTCICASSQFVTGALSCIQSQCPDQVAAAAALQQTLCPSGGASGAATPSASAETPAASAAETSAASTPAAETPAASEASSAASVASSASAVASSAGSVAASASASHASASASHAASSAAAPTTSTGGAGALTIPGKLAVIGAVAGAGLLL
ncbi:hypothetical protein CspeluHIS016_0404040 [Cutaneotrichosporon spelunceum]|uniref:CFEM domain-containing protein n=1 Tax=Cutaneotrichosporon spelunceum TaxID=1672016 RepID=A0AAD3TVD0_9TREE|nr:hypothetical protein CspeluHIS016_0404040 [Cutaneotrichosporon spelunceum]